MCTGHAFINEEAIKHSMHCDDQDVIKIGNSEDSTLPLVILRESEVKREEKRESEKGDSDLSGKCTEITHI